MTRDLKKVADGFGDERSPELKKFKKDAGQDGDLGSDSIFGSLDNDEEPPINMSQVGGAQMQLHEENETEEGEEEQIVNNDAVLAAVENVNIAFDDLRTIKLAELLSDEMVGGRSPRLVGRAFRGIGVDRYDGIVAAVREKGIGPTLTMSAFVAIVSEDAVVQGESTTCPPKLVLTEGNARFRCMIDYKETVLKEIDTVVVKIYAVAAGLFDDIHSKCLSFADPLGEQFADKFSSTAASSLLVTLHLRDTDSAERSLFTNLDEVLLIERHLRNIFPVGSHNYPTSVASINKVVTGLHKSGKIKDEQRWLFNLYFGGDDTFMAARDMYIAKRPIPWEKKVLQDCLRYSFHYDGDVAEILLKSLSSKTKWKVQDYRVELNKIKAAHQLREKSLAVELEKAMTPAERKKKERVAAETLARAEKRQAERRLLKSAKLPKSIGEHSTGPLMQGDADSETMLFVLSDNELGSDEWLKSKLELVEKHNWKAIVITFYDHERDHSELFHRIPSNLIAHAFVVKYGGSATPRLVLGLSNDKTKFMKPFEKALKNVVLEEELGRIENLVRIHEFKTE